MSSKELQKWKNKIDKMSQEECCRLHRFASIEHPIFIHHNNLHKYFQTHFKDLGGFTPELSKKIGWG